MNAPANDLPRFEAFEFDTHEVVVCGQWIFMDGHRVVHLTQPYRSALRCREGVLVDGTLFAYRDLLRLVKSAWSDEEDEDAPGLSKNSLPTPYSRFGR